MGIDLNETDRHVQHLDRRIRALQAGQSDVTAAEDYDELLRIIHFPGYTTPVQLLFVSAVMESLELNVAEGMRLRNVLIEGSKGIIAEAGKVSVGV